MAQDVSGHHETDTAQQFDTRSDSSDIHERKTPHDADTDGNVGPKDVKDDLLSATAAGVGSTVQQSGIPAVHLASPSSNQATGAHQGEVTAPSDLPQPTIESPTLVTNDQTHPTSSDRQSDHKVM